MYSCTSYRHPLRPARRIHPRPYKELRGRFWSIRHEADSRESGCISWHTVSKTFERPFMKTNERTTISKPILNTTAGTSLALPIHPPPHPHPHPHRTNPPDPNSSKRIVPSHTNPAGKELRTSYTMPSRSKRQEELVGSCLKSSAV